jgi:ABC-type multidrug transport system fused ATPase/permease subunit
MVLEAGRIVKFDSPAVLLRTNEGVFKSLMDESEDKDVLCVGQGAKIKE